MRALAFLVIAACGDGRSAPADASEVDFAFSESAYDFGRLPDRVAHPPGVVAIADRTGAWPVLAIEELGGEIRKPYSEPK